VHTPYSAQQQQQQHSLFSQASWGRLEMKPERVSVHTPYSAQSAKIVSSTSFRIITQLDPTKLFLAYELQNELLRLIIIKTR